MCFVFGTPHGMFFAKCVLCLVHLAECSLLNVFCVWYTSRCVYYNIYPRGHRCVYLLYAIYVHVPTVMRIYCVQYMSTCTPLGVGADLSCPHSPLIGNNTLYYIIVLLVLGHDESAPTPHGMFFAECALHLIRIMVCVL